MTEPLLDDTDQILNNDQEIEQRLVFNEEPAYRQNEPVNPTEIYESLDYDTCINTLYQNEERTRGMNFFKRKSVIRWLVVMAIGALTGTLACCIDLVISNLCHYKFLWLQHYLDKCLIGKCLYIPCLLWAALNVGPTLIASLCGSYIEPVSAGSGIPQIKCYLNGVKVPRIVRLKTLVCKVVGVAFSVLGGLAVGKEGPMIHSGAVIAAGISQGKTTSFKYDFGCFKYFRQDKEKRDFVSAGAAAGVAAAFGAPAGGVLFALEEGTSFWNQSLTWRVLFCAMMSVFSLNIIRSAHEGQPGNLANVGLLNFGKFDDLNYRLFEFIPFLFIALCGGLCGGVFNAANRRLTIFRRRYVTKPWRKMAEASLVALLTAALALLMIFTITDCRDIDTEPAGNPVQIFCKPGQESTVAILWLNTPEDSVRAFFHDPKGSYSYLTVVVFFVVYFWLACITYGLGVPSGLFIPTLLMGAAFGRLVGIVLGALFPNQPWTDEGKYALVGAAAFLAGVVRMTLSLAVILMECTGNIMFGLPLMLVLMVSKWIGDLFNEGLYDIHIELMKVPILAWDPPPLSNKIFACQVMSKPVVTLNTVESAENILSVLRKYAHNGFPVVDKHDIPLEEQSQHFGLLRGLILRSQLVVLLKDKIFNENESVWSGDRVTIDLFRKHYPRFCSLDDVEVEEAHLKCSIDLRPFMNPSPYAVPSATTLPRIFTLFRGLGLRHLVVIDNHNRTVGMVTRKDLVQHHS